MLVFRPFKGEIMLGKIASGTENGIKGVPSRQTLDILRADLLSWC